MIWSGAGANETDLVRHIRESLNAVGKEEQKLSEPDWFPRIASTIATNVSSIGLKCYAKGSYHHVTARDFSAFIDDDDKTVPKEELFIAQAAMVGEVEWDENGIDYDFEKLLCVDSLVCCLRCFFKGLLLNDYKGPQPSSRSTPAAEPERTGADEQHVMPGRTNLRR
jgi:hypothetical protein